MSDEAVILSTAKKKPKSSPDQTTQLAIRRVLCMSRNQEFIRCPARSTKKKKAFETEGDMSHSEPGHVCAACRCDNVAGYGTEGNFYGLGESAGHFGCGFCKWHETGRRTGTALEFARNQMKALQQAGQAELADHDYQQVVKYEAKEAERNTEIREGIKLIMETLNQFKELTDRGCLTESSKDGPVDASDKTRIELSCRIAKTVADLAKDKYVLEQNDYIHVDELKIRIPQMLNLALRYILDDHDKEVFVDEFRRIWESAKRGAK